MGRRGSTSKKPTGLVVDKIKKCKQYLTEIQKQKTPSNAEISVLNNNIKLLENLLTAKKNDSKIYCKRPNSILKNKSSNQPTPHIVVTSKPKPVVVTKKKLSVGEIVGIVIGSISGLIILTFIIMAIYKKLKKN